MVALFDEFKYVVMEVEVLGEGVEVLGEGV